MSSCLFFLQVNSIRLKIALTHAWGKIYLQTEKNASCHRLYMVIKRCKFVFSTPFIARQHLPAQLCLILSTHKVHRTPANNQPHSTTNLFTKPTLPKHCQSWSLYTLITNMMDLILLIPKLLPDISSLPSAPEIFKGLIIYHYNMAENWLLSSPVKEVISSILTWQPG